MNCVVERATTRYSVTKEPTSFWGDPETTMEQGSALSIPWVVEVQPSGTASVAAEVTTGFRASSRRLTFVVCATALACSTLTPAAVGAEPRICFGQRTTITGGAASETFVGTAGRDVIDSGAGSDTIYGKGGDDLLCGNFGG